MGWRERKNEKRKQIWMGVLMAALMIFSAFGVYLGSVSQTDSIDYKGHKFKFVEGKYLTKWENKEVPFYNLPQDLEFMNLSEEARVLIQKAWVTQIVFDPAQGGLEYIELTRFDWNRWWGKPLINGVASASKSYPDLPILSCQNASQQSPIIYLNSSLPVSSKVVGNCLILNGLGVDFLRWRDYVLYTHLGWMDQS